MAVKIGAKPGMRILDVGCGVGGPARSIARFSGAKIVGIVRIPFSFSLSLSLSPSLSFLKPSQSGSNLSFVSEQQRLPTRSCS